MTWHRRSQRFLFPASVALLALLSVAGVFRMSPARRPTATSVHDHSDGGDEEPTRHAHSGRAKERLRRGPLDAFPLTARKRSLDLPLCVLHRECNLEVGPRQQFVVTPRLDPRHVRVFPEDAARALLVSPRPWASTTQRVAFVVEDGCAMGHLTKDIGAVMHAARWLEQELLVSWDAQQAADTTTEHPNSPRSPVLITLSVLWASPCVTQRQLHMDEDSTRKPSDSTSSLFVRVLRHWWIALQQWASSTLVHVRIEFVAYEEARKWAAQTTGNTAFATTATVLLRRPLHWRWFRFVRDAQEYRRFVVESYFNLSHVALSRSAAAHGDLRVVLVERVANRHFQERGAAAMLRMHLSPFTAVTPASVNEPDPRPFIVTVQLVRMEALTFPQQVELLAGASVLIAAHGAALALIPLLPPGAWVLELFPVNFGYWLYEELAATSGIHYRSIHGKRVGQACRSKRVCREHGIPFWTRYNETHHRRAEQTSPGLTRAARLYDELRSWNGFSKCKNCDVMWCPEDQGDEREMECMTETLLPAVRTALRNVMRERSRESGAGAFGLASTSWWLDRRS